MTIEELNGIIRDMETMLTTAHDAMVEAEDALTEFCGHNDETRGGWALQSLSRAIDLIAVKQTDGKEPS